MSLAQGILTWPFVQTRRRWTWRFKRQLTRLREEQARCRQRALALVSGSAMARELGFDGARTAADFRRLPVRSYDDIAPYVNRLRDGDATAMFSPAAAEAAASRLVMFALTSGTSGPVKHVPVTRASLRVMARAAKVWSIALARDHPRVPAGKVVNLVSPWETGATPSGTPCGSVSGLIAKLAHHSVHVVSCLPPAVHQVEDYELRLYLALRLAVARRDVTMFNTASPATLLSLARTMDRQRSELLRDLFDGSLHRAGDYSPRLRRRLTWRLRRQRNRARELEGLIARHGRLRPRDAWPELEVLGTWTGGTLGHYLPQLQPWFGDVPVRDLGLVASEGRVTLPLADGVRAGPLDVAGGLFEFIPIEERRSRQPTILSAHEVERGRSYHILLTTLAGLVRYDIGDVVECVDFLGPTPLVRFLHKSAQFSSVTGEKLSASQVSDAVRAALERSGQTLGDFTLAPVWGDPPGYRLLVEAAHRAALSNADALTRQIDEHLQQANIEYKARRSSGRLGGVSVQVVPDGTFDRLRRRSLSRSGAAFEQYKHPCLIGDIDLAAQMLNEPSVSAS